MNIKKINNLLMVFCFFVATLCPLIKGSEKSIPAWKIKYERRHNEYIHNKVRQEQLKKILYTNFNLTNKKRATTFIDTVALSSFYNIPCVGLGLSLSYIYASHPIAALLFSAIVTIGSMNLAEQFVQNSMLNKILSTPLEIKNLATITIPKKFEDKNPLQTLEKLVIDHTNYTKLGQNTAFIISLGIYLVGAKYILNL